MSDLVSRVGCLTEHKADKSKDNKKPKRRLSFRQRSALRLGEIVRLKHWREKYGIVLDLEKWLFVVCHTLAPLKERDGGLDLLHLHDFQKRHSLYFDDDDAVEMIHKVCDYRKKHPSFRNLSPTTVGKYLDLTAEERRGCRITQMAAVDETPEQRDTLRREKDRQRKQRQRRAKGVTPRAIYEANSLSRTQPWKGLNISRDTWERRRSREAAASMSADISILKFTVDILAATPEPAELSNQSRKEVLAERVTWQTTQSPIILRFQWDEPKAFSAGLTFGLAAEIAVQQASLEKKPLGENGARFSATARASSDGMLSDRMESVANVDEREDYDEQAYGRDVRY